MIIDVIVRTDNYGNTNYYVVLDRYPEFKFKRIQKGYLLAEDNGVFQAYKYGAPSGSFKAFAGRKFNINMEDGSIVEAWGQWWDTGVIGIYEELTQVGYSTIDRLKKCYVFTGGTMRLSEIKNWLDNNPYSIDYYKYDNRKKVYEF